MSPGQTSTTTAEADAMSGNISESSENSYDQVPYSSYSFPRTHPDNLATLATLFGMRPPAVDTCRVLELGCGSGGNLLPMAQGLPGAQFVGIDLSPRQIEIGQTILEAVGLSNVTLEARSILDIDASFGQFDYIICHGVYSWVPPAVQARILEVCRQNLSPQGVAYISYNTYPGWHMRGMVREMMNFHASGFDSISDRIKQSRALLDFLIKASANDGNAYGKLLRDELNVIQSCDDSYLFHEHLEEHNEPLYFHQFVQRAADAGLRFLSEALFSAMVPDSRFTPEVCETLNNISQDIIHMEQYQDFLKNRTFRQTLLCQQEVSLIRKITAEHVRNLRATFPLAPESPDTDCTAPGEITYRHRHGASITVRNPVQRAALKILHEAFPASLPFNELLTAIESLVPSALGPEVDRVSVVSELILDSFSSGMVELSVNPPRFVPMISERPEVPALARYQAQRQPTATNLRHESVQSPQLARRIMPYIDGTRTQEEIVELLVARAVQGDLTIHQNEQPVTDPARLQLLLTEALHETLHNLARLTLLIR